MPRIFDNIQRQLLPALQQTLDVAERADFCVGYFNLRGWRDLANYVDRWPGGDGHCCRLLVGMNDKPSEELYRALRFQGEEQVDNQSASRARRRVAEDFKQQLVKGAPNNEDEAALRRLVVQLRANKLVVKVFLRYHLHAKLYLSFRQDVNNPVTGFLGSSNLTFAGLSHQGELNVDVLEHDACNKLAEWFEERWKDRFCIDISKELADIVDASWASVRLVPPYHVYLKMAYHLAQEARAGLSEFRIPKEFDDTLFDFQKAAVQIAAHHLNKRGGVLIGDVVGLGKSIMATALAKVFEEDYHTETLIICPKNLVQMWEGYVHRFRLHAKVMSLTKAIADLPKERRYRLVLIDESHNFRNREGKRWQAIREYIDHNDSLAVLLSATPYNKTYLDLSAQLALFLPDDADIGIRPEQLLTELGGEHEFIRRHQCGVRTLAAFEKSDSPDDWRDLMRLYMVRRTRGFIMQNYAKEDERGKYLSFSDGKKSYFPTRSPKNLKFVIDDANPNDPYARLYSNRVVNIVENLKLPRYGLGNYLAVKPESPPTPQQARIIEGLSRAGTRLMGFCRTNLFKRLESAGPAFLLSVERHILRNFIVLHALENGLDVPLGTQDAEMLDPRFYDEDVVVEEAESEGEEQSDDSCAIKNLRSEEDYRAHAAKVYKAYKGPLKKRFNWLPGSLFDKTLAGDLWDDAQSLLQLLTECGDWKPEQDAKLAALAELIARQHPRDKLLVFTQFADTARYLREQLAAAGIDEIEEATGQSADPTTLAYYFSPESNGQRALVPPSEELRVLIATDVLSEGQNLQDAHIVVNYDLPWAIIRLIQRAGRVDRIGQKSDTILCYSFVPADGVERLIHLRARVRKRLNQNREVVGSDESFFDDELGDDSVLTDLYTEKAGILDDDADTEVDLASYAYQIWKNATDADASLAGQIEKLSDVVYATKTAEENSAAHKGVLVYMRTAHDYDALTWIDEKGDSVTQSQLAILKAAACAADTPALPRQEAHHELTKKGLEFIAQEEKTTGGALGRPSGARFKTYERLKRFREALGDKRDLFETDERVKQLEKALEEIYRYPLFQSAADTLNRQLKAGIDDHKLRDLVLSLREEERLCVIEDEQEQDRSPRLICSMGLV
jgi:superfamily II DNA or RNA helicase